MPEIKDRAPCKSCEVMGDYDKQVSENKLLNGITKIQSAIIKELQEENDGLKEKIESLEDAEIERVYLDE